MKKVFVFILIFIAAAVDAQILSKDAFKTANGKWSIGILGGVLGIYDNCSRGVAGINLTIKGVYVDFMGMGGGSTHEHDVEVKIWKEKSVSCVHLGYQLPFTKGFRLIPIIGYYSSGHVTTNGWDWTIRGGQIQNKTSRSIDSSGFDYGGVLVFNIKHINIYAATSRYMLYGGLAYQF